MLSNGPKRKPGVAILIASIVDFKLKLIKRDGDGHFILITGTVHQDEVSILNIFVPNIKAPTYINETLLELKAHNKPRILLVGYFNTPLFPVDRSTTQKSSRGISELMEVLKQMDITDI